MRAACFLLMAGLFLSAAQFAFSETRIGGVLFRDKNSNGQREKGESGIPGIRISLMSGDKENILGNALSDFRGRFQFSGELMQPKTAYFFVIDADAYKEPIFSSYPTTTDSIGYQMLPVESGREGSSHLNYLIGYSPGFCGYVPNLPLQRSRYFLGRLRNEIASTKLASNVSQELLAYVSEAREALSNIMPHTYRCGFGASENVVCQQILLQEHRDIAREAIQQLKLLARTSIVDSHPIEVLANSFRRKAATIPDVTVHCF